MESLFSLIDRFGMIPFIAALLCVFFLVAAFVRSYQARIHRNISSAKEQAAKNGGTVDSPIQIAYPFQAQGDLNAESATATPTQPASFSSSPVTPHKNENLADLYRWD